MQNLRVFRADAPDKTRPRPSRAVQTLSSEPGITWFSGRKSLASCAFKRVVRRIQTGQTKDNMNAEEIEARLKQLDAQLAPLYSEQRMLMQRQLELRAEFKCGDVIEWECGRRGRVIRLVPWIDRVAYVVRSIRKDGSEGGEHKIHPYQKPKKVIKP